jgi:hypothetical protein
MAPPTRSSRRLPARVYWVRRAVVLVVGLGLVFGVAHLLDGPDPSATDVARVVGAEPGGDTATQAPRATDSAWPEPRRSNRPATGQDDRGAKKTVTPLPEPSGPCRDSDVIATPKVEGTTYAGSPVIFRIRLTSVLSPACTWRVAPAKLAVKLISGSDRIWSSQDCPRAIPREDVVVRQQAAATVEVTWHGQRSDSTCSRTTAWAQPGWYHIQAAAFGGEPTDVQFELRAPVPATITPKPKPRPEKKSSDQPSTQPTAESSATNKPAASTR